MALCIRVPKETGETARRRLISSGLLSTSFKIRTEEDSVLLPILTDTFGDYDVIDADLEPICREETDYRKIADVPEELREMLPNSFDVIGDIAIMRFPDELVQYAEPIGNALLRTSPSVRAVMADLGVKGDMRIRDVRMIAGSGTSETTHKEFGVTMIVDPGKAYFNPRLSAERMRIASLVKDDEVIIDMFAGVAPFPLVISKHATPSVIYSIDINEDAVKLAERNIKMNKVKNIVAICGDSVEAIKKLPPADRIIMNLPHTAFSFLKDALPNLKKGGTAHMHMITKRSLSRAAAEGLADKMKKEGYEIRVERMAELKTYSPTMSVYVLDIVKE
ncbi:MAG: class I SAM-dependent methyltransferase family protein [Methanomassiliicoccaceae archaeon]|nr:class I SAM-dependent methyltransferase family protein [Methanomassiliicoccaceae archaeon]